MTMQVEYIYELQEYLNNLRMFKHLHSFGIDLKPLEKVCSIGNMDYNYNLGLTAYGNLLTIANHLFDIVESYPGDYSPDTIEDKRYWAKLANYTGDVTDSLEVVVMLDEHLSCPCYTGTLGFSELTDCCGELLQIGEYGVALFFDTDDGYLDWAEIVYVLAKSRSQSIARESMNYEVAI